jgi:hypothetical protein
MGPCGCVTYVFENIGMSTDAVSFTDCSGNTHTVSIENSESVTLSINECEPIIYDELNFNVTTYENIQYCVLSSCCSNNVIYVIDPNIDDYITIEYGVNFFYPSDDNLPTLTGCFYVIDKLETIPPYPYYYGGDYTSSNSGVGDCFDCTEKNLCKTIYEIVSCCGNLTYYIYDKTLENPYIDGNLYGLSINNPYGIEPGCYTFTVFTGELTQSPIEVDEQGEIKSINPVEGGCESFECQIFCSPCYCTRFRYTGETQPENIELDYLTCDNTLSSTTVNSNGEWTEYFCTKYVELPEVIEVEYLGECSFNNEQYNCVPPTTTTTTQPGPVPPPPSTINECEPIILFPMEVTCQTVNPTNSESNNGSATLVILGGTPPYDISWENGSKTITIENLSVGSYPASVTDYYGDFTISTVCVLTAQTTTTTSTTSTTTTEQPTYVLCMYISYYTKNGQNVVIQKTFNPDGLYDGYPTWTSEDSTMSIIWDITSSSWVLVNSLSLTVVNINPAYPPINGWQIYGVKGTVTVTQGECVSQSDLAFTYSVNQPTCECNGVITFNATGGLPPYQYSINNGLSFNTPPTSPVFMNLCGSQTYNLYVIDDNGDTSTQTVTLNAQQPIVNYTVTVSTNRVNSGSFSNKTVTTTTSITVSPSLPVGAILTFNLQRVNEFTRTPQQTSFTNSITSSLIKNGNPISISNTSSSNTTQPNTSVGCTSYDKYITTTTQNWNGVTIETGDSISLSTTSNYIKDVTCTPSNCCVGSIDEQIQVTNYSLNIDCANILVNYLFSQASSSKG